MLEWIILGIVQGLSEWLPISSEGMLILTQTLFFEETNLRDSIEVALWLHLGTWLAAVVYLRKDVIELVKSLLSWKSASLPQRSIIVFLIVTTLISGVLGGALLMMIGELPEVETVGVWITGGVGLLLIVTGWLQLRSKDEGLRTDEELNWKDSVLLGILQGFSALPGFSRSGLTVSGLLLRKINKVQALRLSFLMSLPIVLGGNIILSWGEGYVGPEGIAGLISSFVVGLLTIDWFMKVAAKVNFGKFVIWMGGLVVLGSVVFLWMS